MLSAIELKYFLTISLCFIFHFNQVALAQSCQPSPQRNAISLSGEISGSHIFQRSFGDEWSVQLLPSQFGWDLRILDKDGLDLSQITPPFRFAPNPREIYGWHFRNAHNTADNTGDVNAPQHTRLFSFSPSLTGTGGFKPSSINQQTTDSGRGLLRVLDMGLSDLEKGQKARMTYLKFNLCLSWPKTDDEIQQEINVNSPVFSNEEIEIIHGCGLDENVYDLSAWVLPRMITGDLDGDNSHDFIVPIIRRSDGHKAIAICRAGTWLSLIGLNPNAETVLKTGYYTLEQYLDKIEFWELRANANSVGTLIIGQTEKSEVAVTWDGDQFNAEILSHFVEP